MSSPTSFSPPGGKRSGANIRQYIEEYGVDDIYVIYSTNSRFYSNSLQSRLLKYLDLEYPGDTSALMR